MSKLDASFKDLVAQNVRKKQKNGLITIFIYDIMPVLQKNNHAYEF